MAKSRQATAQAQLAAIQQAQEIYKFQYGSLYDQHGLAFQLAEYRR